jgi:hypothetical protein
MSKRKNRNATFLQHGSLKKRLNGKMAIQPIKKKKA